MRLSALEVEVIKAAVSKRFVADSCVLLFGSRVDDLRRSGDIDLLVETL